MTTSLKPSLDDLRHLRAASVPGHMYRLASGTVVINPAPNSRGAHTAVLSPRRNAKAAVVERLLFDELLAEDHNGQFSVTAAGRALLDAGQVT